MQVQLAVPVVACFLVLLGAVGHAAPRDDLADAARAFDEAALRNGDDSSQSTGVRKWMGPIKMAVRNPSGGSNLVPAITNAVRAIAEIAKIEVSEVEASDPGANFIIYFDGNENTTGKNGCQAFLRSKGWPISQVEIKIDPGFRGRVDNCLIHEAMHAFGFWSHPHGGDSVLSYVYQRPQLTTLDINLIKALYDPALKPGTAPIRASVVGCHTLANLMASSAADRAHVCDAQRRVQRSANGEDFVLATASFVRVAGPADKCGERVTYWANLYSGKVSFGYNDGWRTFTADASGDFTSSFALLSSGKSYDFKASGNLKSRTLNFQNLTVGCTWEGALN